MINRREVAVVLLLVLLLAGVWAVVSRVGTAHSGAQTQFVEDAVHNAALTCYAVEGAYPSDLEYLRENYGLAYDESRYFVTYEAFASNLVPEIYVTEVEADES
ncbi:MAG: hypothetical protein IJJ45_07420 [Clostridia bacterium]|nr:hypothetical protein [Clostridia bacterium]